MSLDAIELKQTRHDLTERFLAKSIHTGRVIKIGEADDFWRWFVYSITIPNKIKDPEENEWKWRRPLREGAKGNFGWRVKKGEIEIYDVGANPLYEEKIKKIYSKHQATTCVDPKNKLYPPIFRHRNEELNLLMGIRIDPKDVLIQRIMYDRGSRFRPYQFDTEEEAKKELEWLIKNNLAFSTLDDLVANNNSRLINEVMARWKWNCDGSSQLCIFSDTLKARLLIQIRARDLRRRLEAQYRENEEILLEGYRAPISFYIPRTKETYYYSEEKQQEDRNCSHNFKLFKSSCGTCTYIAFLKLQSKNFDYGANGIENIRVRIIKKFAKIASHLTYETGILFYQNFFLKNMQNIIFRLHKNNMLYVLEDIFSCVPPNRRNDLILGNISDGFSDDLKKKIYTYYLFCLARFDCFNLDSKELASSFEEEYKEHNEISYDFKTKNKDGKTFLYAALYQAKEEGYVELVKTIISACMKDNPDKQIPGILKGNGIDYYDFFGTWLKDTIRKNDIVVVKEIIAFIETILDEKEFEKVINYKYIFYTIISYRAFVEFYHNLLDETLRIPNFDVADLLIAKGAKANFIDYLILCDTLASKIRDGDINGIKKLFSIAKRTILQIISYEGYLSFAVNNSNNDFEIVKFLIDSGAVKTNRYYRGLYAKLINAIKSGDQETTNKILEVESLKTLIKYYLSHKYCKAHYADLLSAAYDSDNSEDKVFFKRLFRGMIELPSDNTINDYILGFSSFQFALNVIYENIDNILYIVNLLYSCEEQAKSLQENIRILKAYNGLINHKELNLINISPQDSINEVKEKRYKLCVIIEALLKNCIKIDEELLIKIKSNERLFDFLIILYENNISITPEYIEKFDLLYKNNLYQHTCFVSKYIKWNTRHTTGFFRLNPFSLSHGAAGRKDAREYLQRIVENPNSIKQETEQFLTGQKNNNEYKYSCTTSAKSNSRFRFFKNSQYRKQIVEHSSLKKFAYSNYSHWILGTAMFLSAAMAVGFIIAATCGIAFIPIIGIALKVAISTSPAITTIIANRIMAGSKPNFQVSEQPVTLEEKACHTQLARSLQ